MDAFEQVVSEILWMQGYWVRTSVKVELTKPDKQEIGRPSSPRWELDVVGYRGGDNVLQVVECKSYFDSQGVRAADFGLVDSERSSADRYKLFNDETLRRVVFERLRQQFTETGACREAPTVRLALACGKIKNGADRFNINRRFAPEGWELWDEAWLRDKLGKLAARGYENQVSSVVAKLLLRGKVE